MNSYKLLVHPFQRQISPIRILLMRTNNEYFSIILVIKHPLGEGKAKKEAIQLSVGQFPKIKKGSEEG